MPRPIFFEWPHVELKKKMQFIFIRTKRILSNVLDDMNITFESHEIKMSKCAMLLGIQSDKYMLFHTHIHQVNKKVTGKQ